MNTTPTVLQPLLTGLHGQLCPALTYTGFQVFDMEHIKLFCSLVDTGKFTKPGTGKIGKKGFGLLSSGKMSFTFNLLNEGTYWFELFVIDDYVYAQWIDGECKTSQHYPLWDAVQEFEKMIQLKRYFKN